MKLFKIFSRIERKFIFLFDGINTTMYMRLYNRWLKRQGIDIDGKLKYVQHTALFDGVSYKSIHLGNNVVISRGCTFLVHDFSIEAGLVAIGKSREEKKEAYFIKDIQIGNDCFVGANTTILGGTVVGNNCIIGAGSVLPGKKYPNNSVIAGYPGRVICKTTDWANKKLQEGEIKEGFV